MHDDPIIFNDRQNKLFNNFTNTINVLSSDLDDKDQLITLYISFCILAMFCNLFVQRIFLYSQHSSSDIIIAIAMGTIAGLIVKYFLDKNWIFNNYEKSIYKNMKYFMKYSFFGIATTLIFWSFELSFVYLEK